MLRSSQSRMRAFFNALVDEEVETFALLLLANWIYQDAIRLGVDRRRAQTNNIGVEFVPLSISIAIFTFVLTRATLRATGTSIHANQKIALAFFKSEIKHPEYKKENAVKIFCPILHDESDHPVCVSFIHENKKYLHAYDYDALKEYFLRDHGTRCPISSVRLNDNNTKELTFSFDVPAGTPELIQAKTAAENEIASVKKGKGYGS